MVIGEVYDYWNEHWEGLVLVGLQDIQEVVIFEEAHGSIGYLQMNTTNASNDSLEQSLNKMFNFIDFTDLKDFL